MKIIYEHVQAHQDRILPWSRLSLEQQLNVICDKLANGAVERAITEGESHSGPKFLPFESVAVVLDGIKLTTNIGSEVRYRLGKEDAERFYTKPRNVVRGTNRGGLGWSSKRFHSALPQCSAEIEARYVSDLAVQTMHRDLRNATKYGPDSGHTGR
jgi:hypothetical protein